MSISGVGNQQTNVSIIGLEDCKKLENINNKAVNKVSSDQRCTVTEIEEMI